MSASDVRDVRAVENTHPERSANRNIDLAGRDVASLRFVTVRHGICQTTLARLLVQDLGALDEIGDVVAKVAHSHERVDVSRRRLLSLALLLR